MQAMQAMQTTASPAMLQHSSTGAPPQQMFACCPPPDDAVADPVDPCCCEQPEMACTDEHCQQMLVDDFCPACLDHQTCTVPGCTFSCDECCANTNCSDLHCSDSTHVHLLIQDHADCHKTTCSPILGHSDVTTPLDPLAFTAFDLSASSQDDYYAYHCHWNHCDVSFTSLFELDNHLFNHIPPHAEEALHVPIDFNFQCQWDECQTKAPTETDLVQHVKINHLPETAAKEHHQCLWVYENGISVKR
jgi:hypothetical protein